MYNQKPGLLCVTLWPYFKKCKSKHVMGEKTIEIDEYIWKLSAQIDYFQQQFESQLEESDIDVDVLNNYQWRVEEYQEIVDNATKYKQEGYTRMLTECTDFDCQRENKSMK